MGTSSPALSADGQALYIGSIDGSLYALSLTTSAAAATVLWQYETGGRVQSTPAYEAGTVVVGSEDHSVYAIDALTGEGKWSYETGDDVDSSPLIANVAGALTVLVGSDGTLRKGARTQGEQRSAPIRIRAH